MSGEARARELYGQEDLRSIRRRLNGYLWSLAGIEAVLIAVYVVLIVKRMGVPAAIVLCAAWCAFAFMFGMYLRPCARYRRFLYDMEDGLVHRAEGTIERIEPDVQLQDGVRVYTVHLVTAEEPDGRIFYINVDKADSLPGAGSKVGLSASGRHIRAVELL